MSSEDKASAEAARLRASLAQAGYTPGKRDVAPLVAMLAGDGEGGGATATAVAVRRALGKADATVVTAAIARALDGADDGAATRLMPALGDAAARAPAAVTRLVATLSETRARVRRAAAAALGKVGGDDARAALSAYWDRADLDPAERRAATEALGKVGGDAAAQRLAASDADGGGDAELARRRGRALLISERDADDADAISEVVLDVAPPAPVVMVARCRAGLETLLAGELHDAGLPVDRLGPGLVRTVVSGPLAPLLSARTLLTAGAVVELRPSTRPATGLAQDDREHHNPKRVMSQRRSDQPGRPERRPSVSEAESKDALAHQIAEALARPDVLALLAAWTRGPIRWRLDFERGGHRRALVWAAAARARELAPALRNQPRASTWEFVVTADEQHLELRPHRYADARFTWRVADVPAASHPTIAAALARVAGAVTGEHVWDPFCGSGAELCERGRLGAVHLHGTDLDERALAAARQNLAAAGLTATLTQADALAFPPPQAGFGLIITNPPLGRRLRGDAGALLERFAARVPSLLAPGGRLVWITPSPDRTGPVLREAGLALGYARDIDLGGYEARLERWNRAAPRAAAARPANRGKPARR